MILKQLIKQYFLLGEELIFEHKIMLSYEYIYILLFWSVLIEFIVIISTYEKVSKGKENLVTYLRKFF